jgi:hypothetical protein
MIHFPFPLPFISCENPTTSVESEMNAVDFYSRIDSRGIERELELYVSTASDDRFREFRAAEQAHDRVQHELRFNYVHAGLYSLSCRYRTAAAIKRVTFSCCSFQPDDECVDILKECFIANAQVRVDVFLHEKDGVIDAAWFPSLAHFATFFLFYICPLGDAG